MKFLVDANLGRKFTELMKHAGYDAVFAKDLMPLSRDDEILAKAESEERIIITNDKDFGELVFRSRRTAIGVILIRTSATDSKKRFDLVNDMLSKAEGKFIVVKEGQVRVRRL